MRGVEGGEVLKLEEDEDGIGPKRHSGETKGGKSTLFIGCNYSV
jgi:hypothetical protein